MNTPIVTQTSPKNQLGQSTNPAWPHPFRGQRRHSVRENFDPVRRLVAAVACQAVVDLIRPPCNPKLTPADRRTAWLFLCQHRQTLRELGVSSQSLDFLAEWLENREEAA